MKKVLLSVILLFGLLILVGCGDQPDFLHETEEEKSMSDYRPSTVSGNAWVDYYKQLEQFRVLVITFNDGVSRTIDTDDIYRVRVYTNTSLEVWFKDGHILVVNDYTLFEFSVQKEQME